MKEQILPDGATNYGQGVIGPSFQDIIDANNPNNPPLGNFPTRADLLPTAAGLATVALVSGCNTAVIKEDAPKETFTNTTQGMAAIAGIEGDGAKESSIGDLFDKFLSDHNNSFVETEDANYKNQCYDLVAAWVNDLEIPLDSVRHLYSSDIYLKPNSDTTDYFSIIPNTADAQPEKGDIVVWGPDYNGGVGHTGIATGNGDVQGKPTDTFEAFEQNDPLNSESHLKTYKYNSVLGWLRPKEFSQIKPEVKKPVEIPEFIPQNGLESARYAFAGEIINFLSRDEKTDDLLQSSLKQSLNLSAEETEELKISLARGEEVVREKPIKYTWKAMGLFAPEGAYYGQKEIGIAYINNLQIVSTEEEFLSDADQANGLTWKGSLKLTGIMSYGGQQLLTAARYPIKMVRDWLEKEEDLNKITNFSEWEQVELEIEDIKVRTDGADPINLIYDYYSNPGGRVRNLNDQLGVHDIFDFFGILSTEKWQEGFEQFKNIEPYST